MDIAKTGNRIKDLYIAGSLKDDTNSKTLQEIVDGLAIATPKRTAQADEPTGEVGKLEIWRDTDDGKVYLIYNDTDSGQKKIELI